MTDVTLDSPDVEVREASCFFCKADGLSENMRDGNVSSFPLTFITNSSLNDSMNAMFDRMREIEDNLIGDDEYFSYSYWMYERFVHYVTVMEHEPHLLVGLAREFMQCARCERVVDVCEAHIGSCMWCDDPYVIPTYRMAQENNTNYRTFDAVSVSPGIWSHQGDLCSSCSETAVRCHYCRDLVDLDAHDVQYLDYSDDWYCDSCYWNYTFDCEGCGERVNDSHDTEECCDSLTPVSGQICSYSYKPAPKFFDHRVDQNSIEPFLEYPYDNHTPYMGFELEVEIRDSHSLHDAATNVGEALGERAYLKSDGSISRGFEIVTHPHSLEAYQAQFDWSFLSWLMQNGGASWRTTTCGLHVHVSRGAFTSLVHQALFTYLIQNNQSQMIRLAGRESQQWARFGEGDAPVAKKVKGQAWDRYQAVNMLNRETVEIRIFRGSLMRTRVMMALELVNACFEYTRRMTTNDYISGNLSWNAFAKWIMSQKKYDSLVHYIKLYGLYDNHTAETH